MVSEHLHATGAEIEPTRAPFPIRIEIRLRPPWSLVANLFVAMLLALIVWGAAVPLIGWKPFSSSIAAGSLPGWAAVTWFVSLTGLGLAVAINRTSATSVTFDLESTENGWVTLRTFGLTHGRFPISSARVELSHGAWDLYRVAPPSWPFSSRLRLVYRGLSGWTNFDDAREVLARVRGFDGPLVRP